MSAQTTTGLIISGIYGAGGNSGATLNADYIELFNGSSAAIDLSTYEIQYVSATGTAVTTQSPLSGTIGAGHFYLISATAGTNGTAITPTPDLVMTTATPQIAFAAAAGKVYLTNDTVKITTVCPMNSEAHVVDAVAFGTTSCSLGTGAAPAPSTTTADIRTNPCVNNADNSKDYVIQSLTASPVIRNSATTPVTCGATPTAPTLTAAITPSTVVVGNTVLLTAKVTKGTGTISSVTVDTSAITGGSATQQLYDDGTHGDATSGDLTYSFTLPIPAAQTAKAYTFTFTVTDGGSLTGTGTANLTVSAVPVVPAISSLVVGASPATAVSGTTIGLTATLAGNVGTPTGGTVTFYDNTVSLGTGTSAGSGVWTYNASTLAVGSHSITASYAGDPVYTTATPASASTPATVTITAPPTPDFTVAVSNNNIILNDDQKTFLGTVAVSFINGFNTPVVLTCSGMPSNSRCAFSPSTLSKTGNSTMTIAVDGASLAPHNSPFGKRNETILAFTLLALPFAFRRKLRQRLGMAGTFVAFLLLGAALVSTTGCGSSATPAANSTITVTATAGSTVHTAAFTLTVQ